MARNKNPTALFDAIHSAKKPPRPSPSGSIPTPKWWGKNKPVPKVPPQMPMVESSENVGKQRSWLASAKRNGAAPIASMPQRVNRDSLPVAEETVQSAASTAVLHEMVPVTAELTPVPQAVETAPKPRFIDRFVNRSSKPEPTFQPTIDAVATQSPQQDSYYEPAFLTEAKPERSSSEEPEDQVEDRANDRAVNRRDDREPIVRMDYAAGDIRFRLSYAGLIAIAFTFVVALAIAFMAGTRAATQTGFDDDGTPAKSSSVSTGPAVGGPTAGLMAAVDPATPSVIPAPSAPVPANPAPAHGQTVKPTVNPDVLAVEPHPVRLVVTDPLAPVTPSLPIKATRDIGMIYVVIQSYPEQELAQKACDFVNQAGVKCTLVQGPSNWAPRDWFSVVGLQAFNKHDPNLPDYEKAVRGLGVKFTSRVIDQFQPQAYTWREDSDLSQP